MDYLEVVRILDLSLERWGSRRVWITFKSEIRKGCFDYLMGISNDTFHLIDKQYKPQVNLSAFDKDTLLKANQTCLWRETWPEGMKPRRFLLTFIEFRFIDTSKFALELAEFIEQISIAA